MGTLFIMQRGTVMPRSSFLGKVSVAVTMVAFVGNLLVFFDWFRPYSSVLTWVEIGATLVLVVSLTEKALLFGRDFKTALAFRASSVTKQD